MFNKVVVIVITDDGVFSHPFALKKADSCGTTPVLLAPCLQASSHGLAPFYHNYSLKRDAECRVRKAKGGCEATQLVSSRIALGTHALPTLAHREATIG